MKHGLKPKNYLLYKVLLITDHYPLCHSLKARKQTLIILSICLP